MGIGNPVQIRGDGVDTRLDLIPTGMAKDSKVNTMSQLDIFGGVESKPIGSTVVEKKAAGKRKKKPEKHRIPYDSWINSQLSIARHYGGCVINGKSYRVDYDNARTEGEGEDKRYFPDLVEV